MVLRLSISDEIEARLRERAAAAGLDVESYASRTLEQAVARISLDDVFAPVRAQFEQSGISEEQLTQLLEGAKHDARADRRKQRAP